MLDKTAFIIPPERREAVVTGQSVAKSARHKTPRQKARKAAEWVTGGMILEPTVKLAAEAFQVSVALVAQEVTKLPLPTPIIDRVWVFNDRG